MLACMLAAIASVYCSTASDTRRVLDPSAAGFEQGNGASALHAAVENNHPEV